MMRIKKPLLKGLSVIALLGSFVILLGLIIFFVINPQVFERTKNVIAFLFEFCLLGSLVTYLGKRIKKGAEIHGSLSNSLTKLIIDEPLIHSMIWVFIVVQLIVFSYILPVHYLDVKIIDRTTSAIINSDLIEKTEIKKDDDSYRQPAKAVFSTLRFLAWGESVNLYVKARGYDEYQAPVAWPGLALRDVIKGNKQLIELAPEGPVTITLQAYPSSSQIHVQSSIDTLIKCSGIIKLKRDETVAIKVSAKNYCDQDTTFVVKKDVEINFVLSQKSGTIIFRAFDEGGIEKKRMTIYIDGELIPQKSGQVVLLRPGDHRVKLVKNYSNNERAIVDEFLITIKPGDNDENSRTVRIERF